MYKRFLPYPLSITLANNVKLQKSSLSTICLCDLFLKTFKNVAPNTQEVFLSYCKASTESNWTFWWASVAVLFF